MTPRRPASLLRLSLPALALLCLLGAPASAAPAITMGGEGWVQYGRIVRSTDTSTFDYNGDFMRATAAQLSLRARFSEKLEVGAGLGAMERHFLLGGVGNNGGRNPVQVYPYIVEARFTSTFWNGGEAGEGSGSALRLTGGFFPYNYNPDVKNLGLYLLRGPVYPGIVVSGFETRHVLPLANTLGFHLHHRAGAFEQDFILASEHELYPLFDVSPAYIASYRFGKVLRVGAGVNFYHLLPVAPRLTNPDTLAYNGSDDASAPLNRSWIYVDTAGPGSADDDTTYLSFAGTKLMANASLDIKALFGGLPALGPEDLKLYGEVALIGLDRRKAYQALYGGYSERMPVMVGFNFPAFKMLDHLSLEVEHYGARFRDDLKRYQATNSGYPSPIPAAPPAGAPSTARDDWKWSLHAARSLGASVRLSAQIANDHTRPGGKLYDPAGEWQSIFAAPRDWYWMGKLAFFF
jgi:hypothetical protein